MRLTKRHRAIVVAVGAILIFGIAGLALQPHEPAFGQKRLTQWLNEGIWSDAAKAEPAIRGIGPEAIPWLLRDLQTDDSSWRERSAGFLDKHPRFRWLRMRFPSASDRQRRAHFGFKALGSAAQPAVPSLIRMLSDSRVRARQNAASVLSMIGPDAKGAVYPLITATKDEDDTVRRWAVYALGNLKAEGKPAVPALRRMLRDPDYVAWITRSVKPVASPGVFGGYVLHPVTVALGNIGPAATEAVPDLLEMLRIGEPFARASAARALAKIAPGSRQVIAALEEAFESEDQNLSAAASAALQEIFAAPAIQERLRYGSAVLKTLGGSAVD